MRQLRDMSIMEIDITNACPHSCSNCTRFCGHHEVGKGRMIDIKDGRNKAILSDYLAAAKAQRWFQGAMNRGRGYPSVYIHATKLL